MTEPLSPAAQAVLDAFNNRGLSSREWQDGKAASLKLAAALEAAADQVVPEAANAVGDEHDEARLDQWLRIRWKLLAIAAELEAQP